MYARFISFPERVGIGRVSILALLAMVLVLAFWVRASATDYGLPYVGYQPDEYLVADDALAMLKTGDFDVRSHPGPRLQIYIQAVVGEVAMRYRSLIGQPVSASNILLTGDSSFWGGLAGIPEYYLWGRIAVASMGSLTVLLVYLITRAIYTPQSGLIAAAFLALSPLHERESRWMTTDVPVTFFVVASFLAMALAIRHGHYWMLAIGFILAGLAMYTKSSGRIVLLPTVLFSLAYVAKGRARQLAKIGYVIGGLLVVGLLAAPFHAGSSGLASDVPNYVFRPIWENSYVYGGSHPGFDGPMDWLWAVGVLGADEWKYVAILGVPAAAWLALRRPWWTGLVASIPLACMIVFSVFTVRFDRWLIPMLPFLAILAGALLWEVVSATVSRLNIPRLVAPAVCVVLTAVLLKGPLTTILERHNSLAAPDPRTAASEWIVSNLQRGSKMALERYSPSVSFHDFDVYGEVFLADRDLDWYRHEGFDYVVASSGAYGRFLANSSKYPKQSQRYEAMFKEFTLVKEFAGQGSTVKILKVGSSNASLAIDGASRK